MSHDLTETASFDTPIIVPDPGDAAQASVLSAAYSALANRSQYLKQYTDQVASGVHRIRRVYGLAMPTTAGVVNGDIVYDPGKGFFYFYVDTAHSFTPDGHWVIASTVITDGVWLNVEYGRVNTYGGFPSIGPTFKDSGIAAGKIKQSLQTNYLYAMERMPTTGTLNTLIEASGTAEIDNTRFSLAVQSGDKILFNLGPINLTNNKSSLQYIEFRYSTDNGSSWVVLERFLIRSGNSELSAAINAPINFTGIMVFSLWGITDATDALAISTARTHASGDMGMYTHFKA